jgi:hypothetical protein
VGQQYVDSIKCRICTCCMTYIRFARLNLHSYDFVYTKGNRYQGSVLKNFLSYMVK